MNGKNGDPAYWDDGCDPKVGHTCYPPGRGWKTRVRDAWSGAWVFVALIVLMVGAAMCGSNRSDPGLDCDPGGEITRSGSPTC